MNPTNLPLSEQDFEKSLSSLPRFQMSARGDELFYSKLNALIATKRSERYVQEDVQEKAPSLGFGFKRFAFSFGLGLFAVTASFTGLSYRDSVTYGSLLYPIKEAAENVEGLGAFTTEQKVNTELRFSDRRLRESWQIVGSADDTGAWLIQTAYAQGPVSTNSEKAQNLKHTLSEMNNHVSNASRIVESQTLDAKDAVALLDNITQHADEQVSSLKKMREQASVENKLAVHMAAASEEKYLVKLIVAREDIREVASKQGNNTRVRLAQFSSIMPNQDVAGVDSSNGFSASDASNMQAAQSALTLLGQKVKLLPTDEQAKLSARVVEAQRALDQGKTGTAYGLSIALSKQVAEARGVVNVDNQQVADVHTNSSTYVAPQLLPNNVQTNNSVRINQQQQNVNVSAPNQNNNVRVQQQGVNVQTAVGGVSVFDLLNAEPAQNVQVNNNVQVNVPQQNVQTNQPVSITPSNVYITPDVNVNYAQPQVTQPVTVQPQVNVTMPTPQMYQPNATQPVIINQQQSSQVQVTPTVKIQIQPFGSSVNVGR